jgi:hypothetical protein
MKIDLRADLIREDDDGLGWTLLSGADLPEIVRSGAFLRAGNWDVRCSAIRRGRACRKWIER